MRECYVILGLALKYLQLNDRRWIYWTTIRRCYQESVKNDFEKGMMTDTWLPSHKLSHALVAG